MSHSQPVSNRIDTLAQTIQPFMRFYSESAWASLRDNPEVNDFALGNPQEMPLGDFSNALQNWSKPQDKDWFAYKVSEPKAQALVAESLRTLRGIPFEAVDIAMTNGGFAAIRLALQAVVNPDDEVIFNVPPWFFYEMLIVDAGAVPVRVKIKADDFDLDIDAIEAAITEKTRVVLVNSPNNPTGKMYPAETLQALADLLTRYSEKYGRTIYLLSDEAYSRIMYDGRDYVSPTNFYPNTLLLYTYGKTLLTPGQRLGYIALPPTMPERETIRNAIFIAQIAGGFAFPNALLQHALGDLEKLSIDIEHLQYKRDWIVRELQAMGYDVHLPEGTFYLLPKSPIDDDWEFAKILGQHKILCLPGTIVEMPGYFRLSLTANDTMIERALPGFKAALEQATG